MNPAAQESTGATSERRMALVRFVKAHLREVILAVLVVALIVGFSLYQPRKFATTDYARGVLNNLAADGVLAVGMMALLITGVFDLSVGSTFALTGALLAYLTTGGSVPWPAPFALVAALSAAILCGLLNGVLVAVVRVNPLITTLGTMGIYRGIALLIGGAGLDLPASLTALPQKDYYGLYLFVAATLLFHYFLAHTRFFRQFYYVGSNPRAGELSGIPVKRVQIVAFTIMGLLAGLAGTADAIRFEGASGDTAHQAELRAISAVVLGGASLSGGRGTIPGAVLGVTFMALVGSVMNAYYVSAEWQQIVVSGILVAIVALDAWMNRR